MSQGLVSVIMGTYDPDCGKLKKSVESIIALPAILCVL